MIWSEHQGRHFSFFQGGGKPFDRLPRCVGGRAKYEEKNRVQKHKKVTIFQIQGEANAPPLPPK